MQETCTPCHALGSTAADPADVLLLPLLLQMTVSPTARSEVPEHHITIRTTSAGSMLSRQCTILQRSEQDPLLLVLLQLLAALTPGLLSAAVAAPTTSLLAAAVAAVAAAAV